MAVQMNIESNLGYAADQISTEMTLEELLAQVQEAIDEWGGDQVVVINQTNNSYGANFGRLHTYGLFESTNGTCDECGSTLTDDGECHFTHDDDEDDHFDNEVDEMYESIGR